MASLLFLCYVNGMVLSTDPDCEFLLYADNSTILFSTKEPNLIANKLGKVLESYSDWLVDNKMPLRLEKKTECIRGSKRKLKKVKVFNVVCNGHKLNQKHILNTYV